MLFWGFMSLLLGAAAMRIPCSTAREMLGIVDSYLAQVVDEAGDADVLFTDGALDRGAVHEGAVGAVEVLDHRGRAVDRQDRVAFGDVRERQPDAAGLGAADEVGAVLQLARLLDAVDDRRQVHRRTPLQRTASRWDWRLRLSSSISERIFSKSTLGSSFS